MCFAALYVVSNYNGKVMEGAGNIPELEGVERLNNCVKNVLNIGFNVVF